MSETIEESGSNVRKLAAALGTGRTRWRFESGPDGVDEPDGMDSSSRTKYGPSPYLYYSFTFAAAQSRGAVNGCILLHVCGCGITAKAAFRRLFEL